MEEFDLAATLGALEKSLKAFADFSKVEQQLKENVKLSGEGEYKAFFSAHLNVTMDIVSDKKSNIAYSTFALNRNGHDHDFIGSLRLIRKKKLRSPFIQQILFAREGVGKQAVCMSRLARKGDLLDYLGKHGKYLSSDEIKSMFAQLILAVEELHSKNLVHRDLALENTLVDVNNHGNLHLCVADFDTLAEINKYGQPLKMCIAAGRLDYLPTEMVSEKVRQQILAEKCKVGFKDGNLAILVGSKCDVLISRGDYSKMDLRRLDTYALGVMFYYILEHSESEDKDLEDLVCKMVGRRFLRYKLEQVKSHKLFGKSKAESENYFKSIENSFSSETQIDGYVHDSIRHSSDCFYLLPQEIKEIYVLANDLYAKLSGLETILQNEKVDKVVKKVKTIIMEKHDELIAGIDVVLESANEVAAIYENELLDLKDINLTKLAEDMNEHSSGLVSSTSYSQ